MATIRFKATLFRSEATGKNGPRVLLTLPRRASTRLPSRGMTMVEGTINGSRFQAALEPDGKGSHWFQVKETILEAARAAAGDTVTLEIEPAGEWPEPRLPADLENALAADPQARALDGDHAAGALGLDPLDKLGQTTGNAQSPDRERLRDARGRKAQALLLQPHPMHADRCIKQMRDAQAP